jgi:hypothetical protein
MRHAITRMITTVAGCLALALAGCATDGQTDASGSGLGFIAGGAVSDSPGHIVGRQREWSAASTSVEYGESYAGGAQTSRPPAPRPNPLIGTSWNVVHITGDPPPERYASIVVHFRSMNALTTVITYTDGRVETTDERYAIGQQRRFVVWTGRRRIDGNYRIRDDTLTITAPDFRLVAEPLDE